MQTLTATVSALTHALSWALLFSLWQGLLVYGLLYLLLKMLPNINARVKYTLSLGAFSVLFLWFANTWVSQYEKVKEAAAYYAIQPTEALKTATTAHAVKVISGNHIQTQYIPAHILPRIENYFPLLMLIYSLGLAFMLCRLLINIVQVRGLRKQGTIIPGAQWSSMVTRLQQQFAITRPVKLFLSTRINVPMMLGTLKPIILLPVATVNHLTTEQVEAILLHELAHIKRHDYLLNIFQTIAETILFFNPFVWLLSGIIRREREHCCDDLVVAASASPLPYAHALAILESTRANNNSLTLAVTGRKKYLLHRIKRIMEMKKSHINYSQLAIILVAVTAITCTIAVCTFTPSFAQNKNTKTHTNKDTTDVIHKRIEIVTKDNTRISGDIFVYPKGKNKINPQLSFVFAPHAIDWDEIRSELDKTIAEAYKNIKDPQLVKEIITGLNDYVDREEKEINEATALDAKEKGNKHREEEIRMQDEETKPWDKNTDVRISMTDDKDTMPGVRVYTKVIVDGSGRQKTIRTRKYTNGNEEEIVSEDSRQMIEDMEQMANGLKDMAKNLTGANVDVNGVNWNELQEELRHNLSALDEAFNDETLTTGRRKELEISKRAIKDAEKEIDKAGKLHEKVLASAAKAEREEARKETKRDIEQSKKDIEQSKRDVEQSKKDVEQSKRDVAQSKKDLAMDRKITNSYEPMLAQMEQEGLIDRSANYIIVKNSEVMYINEKKQPGSVYQKYERYLKDKSVVIREHEGKRTISVED